MSICLSWLADRFDGFADRFHTVAGRLRGMALSVARPMRPVLLAAAGAAIYAAFFGLLILSLIAGGSPQ